MKVLILKPRLDLPFKKFGLEISNRNLPDIRKHWEKFVEVLHAHHVMKGDDVVIVHAPRWSHHHTLVEKYNPDRAYIPHVERHNFKGDERCMYYMQTVIPWLFTIDPVGWGGGASFVGQDYDALEDNGITFARFQRRTKEGGSKFEQPNDHTFQCGEDFVFCPLQIPHDETIKWHSKVKVEELAEKLCHWSETSGVPVVFKSHPVNPSSQEHIRKMVSGRAIWIEKANIHHVMKQAKAVYVVNSGTGMEAMTHEVPVVRFGDAEYNDAVIAGNINDLNATYKKVCQIDAEQMVEKYKKFYNWFVNRICYDVTNRATFMKLK